ncbi:MAG: hypothetical protein FJX29_00590 [Alphaproteobacteria bacterium]|nr:hypothetical protein [Alphaproteobacteria bacterium]
MNMGTATPAAEKSAGVLDIQALMRSCKFEATRPSDKDVEALRATLAPGTHVYLTMLPHRVAEEIVASAKAIRGAGLEPVPHLSVRHFEKFSELDATVGQLARDASVTRVLLIGGDTAKPAGEIPDVLSVITRGMLQANGIRAAGVAGFPDGHPAVSDEELEASLVTKLAALQSAGVEGYIVTQFCFHAKTLIRWLEWLRARGIDAHVNAGLAGPTSLMTWLNYARKCGVKASAEALASRSGLVKHAFKSVLPDPIIRSLADAAVNGHIANVSPHLFAFGGIGATAKWAAPAIAGAIQLNSDRGFDAI